MFSICAQQMIQTIMIKKIIEFSVDQLINDD